MFSSPAANVVQRKLLISKLRKIPLSSEERDLTRAMLHRDQALVPTAAEVKKLDALNPVLITTNWPTRRRVALVYELATGLFTEQREDVLFLGPPGLPCGARDRGPADHRRPVHAEAGHAAAENFLELVMRRQERALTLLTRIRKCSADWKGDNQRPRGSVVVQFRTRSMRVTEGRGTTSPNKNRWPSGDMS
jgi:hypothetical protein